MSRRFSCSEDEHERRLEEARREGREQVYARLVGTANEHLARAMRRHFGDVPKVYAYATWRKVEEGAPRHAHFAVDTTTPGGKDG